ncbi:MAG: alpha/beta hydrolase [Alphaproteobacteria bacterium]
MPEIIFNGTAGRIEGHYHQSADPQAPVALIVHPHPQHGGTMHNKVAYALYRVFSGLGFNTLRFNFRGVGRSEGKFDNGDGELNDSASALDWLQAHNPNASSCWIAGFSFGSWVGMQLLMRRPEFAGFIAVSPPADRYDFNFLAPCPVSGLIIQGGADTTVPTESVTKLVNKLKAQRGLEIGYDIIPGADHCFTDHLGEMCRHVGAYVHQRSTPSVRKAG